MKHNFKEIVFNAIPAIAFIFVYKYVSFKYAVILGFGIGIILYSYKYHEDKKLTTLNYIGIFGLIIQTTISLFAENPKTYFIYPLISNIIYTLIFGISLLINKDLISIIARSTCDTEDTHIFLKPVFSKLTFIWFLLFLIKVIIKIIGISSLPFESLYVISWIMGTPVSILLLWFTYWYPDNYYFRYNEKK